MTDRERIEFLRQFVHGIGHTDGEPFEKATVKLHTGRPFDLFSMEEIIHLINHVSFQLHLGGAMSPTDKFVMRMLHDNGLLNAFCALDEYMETQKSKDA